MGVISIRLPDDIEDVYKRRGERPARLAKEFLMERARGLEIEAWARRLEEGRTAPSKPIVDLLREIRDGG